MSAKGAPRLPTFLYASARMKFCARALAETINTGSNCTVFYVNPVYCFKLSK